MSNSSPTAAQFEYIIIIIIIKPRLTRHMSVTKEDESQARGHEIVYG